MQKISFEGDTGDDIRVGIEAVGTHLQLLVDGDHRPLALHQGEAHIAAGHLHSLFQSEDEVLARSGRDVSIPKRDTQQARIKGCTRELWPQEHLLDVVGKIANIHNGTIGEG